MILFYFISTLDPIFEESTSNVNPLSVVSSDFASIPTEKETQVVMFGCDQFEKVDDVVKWCNFTALNSNDLELHINECHGHLRPYGPLEKSEEKLSKSTIAGKLFLLVFPVRTENSKNFVPKKPENPFLSYDLAKNLLEVQKLETGQITGRRTTGIFYG